jgi:hypothetical protein
MNLKQQIEKLFKKFVLLVVWKNIMLYYILSSFALISLQSYEVNQN